MYIKNTASNLNLSTHRKPLLLSCFSGCCFSVMITFFLFFVLLSKLLLQMRHTYYTKTQMSKDTFWS